jgi:hypothetical protein
VRKEKVKYFTENGERKLNIQMGMKRYGEHKSENGVRKYNVHLRMKRESEIFKREWREKVGYTKERSLKRELVRVWEK